jgi:hypothetical protein
MLKKTRLATIIAAVAVASQFGVTSSASAMTKADFRLVREMVEKDQGMRLKELLDARSDLMEGDTELARELRAFHERPINLLARMNLTRAIPASLSETVDTASTTSIY